MPAPLPGFQPQSWEHLGPWVRLWGITHAQLPSPSETPDGLAAFFLSLLSEADPFVDSMSPRSGVQLYRGNDYPWHAAGSKKLAGSAARVDLWKRYVTKEILQRIAARGAVQHGMPNCPEADQVAGGGETWVLRRSVHADEASPGTASWAEFVDCIRDRHAETEDAFTPTVLAHREAAAAWHCEGIEVADGGLTWGGFTMTLLEVKHKIPSPLNNRVFAVLQFTCAALPEDEKKEFLVVSVPIADWTDAPQAQIAKEKGIVLGAYVSIERVRKMEDGNIEWIMATASDAKGILPGWIQNMSVPGQIAKDVPMFFSWLATQRSGQGKSSVHPSLPEETGAPALEGLEASESGTAARTAAIPETNGQGPTSRA